MEPLSGRTAFRMVYERGERVRGELLSAVYVRNAPGHLRLGFSVSRKLGRSVARNRFKRRVRSVLREREKLPPVDLVIRPRLALGEVGWEALRVDLNEIVERILEAVPG